MSLSKLAQAIRDYRSGDRYMEPDIKITEDRLNPLMVEYSYHTEITPLVSKENLNVIYYEYALNDFHSDTLVDLLQWLKTVSMKTQNFTVLTTEADITPDRFTGSYSNFISLKLPKTANGLTPVYNLTLFTSGEQDLKKIPARKVRVYHSLVSSPVNNLLSPDDMPNKKIYTFTYPVIVTRK